MDSPIDLLTIQDKMHEFLKKNSTYLSRYVLRLCQYYCDFRIYNNILVFNATF